MQTHGTYEFIQELLSEVNLYTEQRGWCEQTALTLPM